MRLTDTAPCTLSLRGRTKGFAGLPSDERLPGLVVVAGLTRI
jgi:hypothetical protein